MAFTEIPIDRLDRYAPLLPGPQLALLMQSVCAGNTVARLWISGGTGQPDTLILWDFGNKGIYVGGDLSSNHSRAALQSLIRGDLTELARTSGLRHLGVRVLLPEATSHVVDAFGDRLTASSTKLFHEHPGGSIPELVKQPTDFQLVGIDRDLLRSGMANSELVTSEIKWMWPSVDRFLARGWGIAAVIADQIVCWCTAEYVGPSQCGIGIETIDTQMNKGVATATAARFIEESLKRGCKPCWECEFKNLPSLRVAHKLGFRLTESTDWHLGRWQ
jgi:hypothetical protein